MNNLLELQILDYIVIIFSLIFTLFGFWKGFINSILSLLTWVGSVFITIYSYNFVSSFITDILLNFSFLSNFEGFITLLSTIISIILIFLLSLFVLKRFRNIISNDLDKKILGLIIDKFFGIIYGILFSYIFFSTLLYITENSLQILIDVNMFLKEYSNILKIISENNNELLKFYTNKNID